MSSREAAWRAGGDGAEVLAPEGGLIARLDPADFGESVLSVLGRAALRPAEVAGAWARFGTALAKVGPAAAARWLGSQMAPPVPADPGDRRFPHPPWDGNPRHFPPPPGYPAPRRRGRDPLPAGPRAPPTHPQTELSPALFFPP